MKHCVIFISAILLVFQMEVHPQGIQKIKYQGNDIVKDEIIIKFKRHSGVTSQSEGPISRSSILRNKKAAVKKIWSTGAEHWKISTDSLDALLRELKNNPEVEYAEPNYIIHESTVPNDQGFNYQWAVNGTTPADIGAMNAWNITTGDTSIVVGVIDSGIDYLHEDLKANIWINKDEIPGNGIDDDKNGYIDDIHGWDFYNNDNVPMDDNHHGTHVAGIIGAKGNNNVGVAGVAWNVKLAALKILNSFGVGTVSVAVDAIEYCIKKGIKIANCSWGDTAYSNALYDELSKANQAGVIIVAASGNDTIDNDVTPQYPASFDLPNIISVAANDSYGNLATFSNYGRTSVDLSAPGVNIYSCVLNNYYDSSSGTSMAAPMVTGAIVLIKSVYPEKTSAEIINLLLSSVNKSSSMAGKTVTGGILNLFKPLTTFDKALVRLSCNELNLGGVVLNSSNMPKQKLTIINSSADNVNIDTISVKRGFLISKNDTTFSGTLLNIRLGSNQSLDIMVKADPGEEKLYDTLITFRFSHGTLSWSKEVRCRQTVFSKGTTVTSEEVSGKWTKEMSPVIINSQVKVASGQKLDIDPGVEVIFFNNSGITSSSLDTGVEFNIRANGTRQDSIYFRPADSGTPWSGFSFTGRGKYIFEYCNFLNASKSSTGPAGGAGGSIYCAGPDLRIVNSSFFGSHADNEGGAVKFAGSDGTVFIDSSRFISNDAVSGGALVLRGKENWLMNSLFMNNSCSQGIVRIGGESADLNKNAFVYNCSFINNTSSNGGNMIDASSMEKIIIKNCLGARNNISLNGGVISLNTISAGIISNCTLYDNSGIGTALKAENARECLLENSILWNQFATEISAPQGDYQKFTASFNSIKNYSGGNGNINIAPDYADTLLFSLSANSALKDKGNPLEIYNDQDGSRNDPGFKGGNPLAIYPVMIDFGKTGLLNSAAKTVPVEYVSFNRDTLTVPSWNVSSDAFTVSAMPEMILPFKSNAILISFSPKAVKSYSDTLYINTGLSSVNKIKILLSGVCEDINSISGEISGELKNTGTGTYHVVGDIIVPKDTMLTIDAGVRLIFEPNTRLTVEGDLEVKGTPEQKVVFSSESDTSYAGVITLKGTNRKNILLENLTVRKMLGFNIQSAAHRVIFNNCEFSDNKNSTEVNFPFLLNQGSIAEFNGCKFTSNSTQGPLIYSVSGKLFVNNCLISRNTSLRAYILLESNKTYIYNSSIFNNKSNLGIMAGADPSGAAFADSCRVINTILSDNVNAAAKYQYEISLVARGASEPQENPNVKIYLELTNSCIKGGEGKLFSSSGSMKFLTSNYLSDPVFADSYGNLSGSSPCINAGTNTDRRLKFSVTDMAGNFRIWNRRIDMGAYEYASKPYYAVPEKAVPEYPKDQTLIAKDVTFRWKLVGEALTYHLQISDSAAFTKILADSVLADTTLKKSLNYGSRYFWRVSAHNGQNAGPWSDVWSFNTLVAPPSSSPILKAPADRVVNQPLALTLKWRKFKGAEKYQLQVSTEYNFSTLLVNDSTLTDTLKQVPGLSNNTEYHWRVRALNQGGAGWWSEEWTFKTLPPLPGVPMLAKPLDGSKNDSLSLKLHWKENQFTDRYRLLVSEDDKFTKIIFADSTHKDTVKEVNELKEGMKYFWKVSSINASGEIYSGAWSFTTLLNQPDSLRTNVLSYNELKLEWKDRSNGEAGFIIERKESADYKTLDTVGANITSYSDTTVKHLSSYQYRIKSYTAFVSSAYTVSASAAITGVEEIRQIPKDYTLLQNYPNPFNPVTVIKYGLPSESHVKLLVYNSLGQEVREYVNEIQSAGFHQISFNAGRLSSGVYYYLLEARATDGSRDYRKVRKMMVVK